VTPAILRRVGIALTAAAAVLLAFGCFFAVPSQRAFAKTTEKASTKTGAQAADNVENLRKNVSDCGKALAAAVEKGESRDSITVKQAAYVQALLLLQRYANGGVFPDLKDFVKILRLISELPDSPLRNCKVHLLGIGDKHSPGDIVYLTERSPRGTLTGYWLIPIGTPRREPVEAVRPLPRGIPVPAGALKILEHHQEGYVGKL